MRSTSARELSSRAPVSKGSALAQLAKRLYHAGQRLAGLRQVCAIVASQERCGTGGALDGNSHGGRGRVRGNLSRDGEFGSSLTMFGLCRQSPAPPKGLSGNRIAGGGSWGDVASPTVFLADLGHSVDDQRLDRERRAAGTSGLHSVGALAHVTPV